MLHAGGQAYVWSYKSNSYMATLVSETRGRHAPGQHAPGRHAPDRHAPGTSLQIYTIFPRIYFPLHKFNNKEDFRTFS